MTPTYVCPDCKTPLNAFYCSDCEYEFPRLGEIPRLLSRDRGFAQTEQVAAAYDAIYADGSNVWANQGRTPEFIAYFSALVDRLPHARSLEIGCGEGFLLAARSGGEKFAVDLSIAAICTAKTRADAHYSLALAECLPYWTKQYNFIEVAMGVTPQ